MDGKGKIIDVDGTIMQGLWKAGKFINWIKVTRPSPQNSKIVKKKT